MSAKSHAQFWFGPKAGMQFNKHAYQKKTYSAQYDVATDINWHAGFAMQYTTDRKFAVHTELIYQQIKNSVTNLPSDPDLESKSTYSFLSAPMLGRYTAFTAGPISFYLLAGPKLSYWINGSGSFTSQQLKDDFGIPESRLPLKYSISFTQTENPEGIGQGTLNIGRPNRLQYGFDFGAGALIDLASGQRISVEARYTKGHSNMAFNDDIAIATGLNYSENFEHANNQISLSVGLLFGYNPTDQRKGTSTNKLSNKK